MAFENVNSSGNGRKAIDLKVGESITGYALRLVENKTIGATNLELALEDGERITLFPAGNIRYAITDGKIKMGLLTRFTRTEDRMVKGKKSSQFTIEQDPENVYSDFDAAGVTSDVADLTQKAATSSIKERAAALAKQVNKN